MVGGGTGPGSGVLLLQEVLMCGAELSSPPLSPHRALLFKPQPPLPLS